MVFLHAFPFFYDPTCRHNSTKPSMTKSSVFKPHWALPGDDLVQAAQMRIGAPIQGGPKSPKRAVSDSDFLHVFLFFKVKFLIWKLGNFSREFLGNISGRITSLWGNWKESVLIVTEKIIVIFQWDFQLQPLSKSGPSAVKFPRNWWIATGFQILQCPGKRGKPLKVSGPPLVALAATSSTERSKICWPAKQKGVEQSDMRMVCKSHDGSMGLVYSPTWIVDGYGQCRWI